MPIEDALGTVYLVIILGSLAIAIAQQFRGHRESVKTSFALLAGGFWGMLGFAIIQSTMGDAMRRTDAVAEAFLQMGFFISLWFIVVVVFIWFVRGFWMLVTGMWANRGRAPSPRNAWQRFRNWRRGTPTTPTRRARPPLPTRPGAVTTLNSITLIQPFSPIPLSGRNNVYLLTPDVDNLRNIDFFKLSFLPFADPVQRSIKVTIEPRERVKQGNRGPIAKFVSDGNQYSLDIGDESVVVIHSDQDNVIVLSMEADGGADNYGEEVKVTVEVYKEGNLENPSARNNNEATFVIVP